jgi:putative ABC transport system permease protein
MFGSYFAVAVRHLFAQKLYTSINILGLAIGVACCALIALFIRHETSYDRQYAKSDRIYRISRDYYSVDGQPERHLATIAPVVTPLIKEHFPEIEHSARISKCGQQGGGAVITDGKKSFYEPGFAGVDNELFQIFDFEWVAGDPATALTTPNTMVITESLGRRYFGDENPLGRQLGLERSASFEIAGVLKDWPDDTHVRFDVAIPLLFGGAQIEEMLKSWGQECFHTYVLLKEGASIDSVRRGSAQFFETRFREGSSRATGFTAMPIKDIHLRSAREGEMRTPGSIQTIYTFGAIAVFVLLIACINFMNLATARAAQRAKEVGVRKSIGARRSRLIAQFLGESVLVTAMAVLLATVLVALALPPFAAFVEKRIELGDFLSPQGIALLAAFTLVIGLAAGSYPAFYLSRFNPARVLKGDVTRGGGAAAFRKALVVVQFAISIALVIATIVVFQQARFARSLDLGYQTEQIVVMTGSPNSGLGNQFESMKGQWLANPDVLAVTASAFVPGAPNNNVTTFRAAGADDEGQNLNLMPIELDFFETYGIDVVAGRSFSVDRDDRLHFPQQNAPTPAPSSVILSELAAQRFGWAPEEAVGRFVGAGGIQGEVIGVVEDVYLESVREPIKPMIYAVWPVQTSGFRTIREASIRISGRNLQATLDHIDAMWRQFAPSQPVTRRFLDADFAALYRAERSQARMFTVFALLAITVACLGLFGLASFTTARRTKEIGLRRTVGAGVWDIVRLFTREFTVLVVIANVVAWPAAFVLMRQWLEGFAYRVEIGPLAFAASALLALGIAWLTVAAVVSRAARAKPATALRYE